MSSQCCLPFKCFTTDFTCCRHIVPTHMCLEIFFDCKQFIANRTCNFKFRHFQFIQFLVFNSQLHFEMGDTYTLDCLDSDVLECALQLWSTSASFCHNTWCTPLVRNAHLNNAVSPREMIGTSHHNDRMTYQNVPLHRRVFLVTSFLKIYQNETNKVV